MTRDADLERAIDAAVQRRLAWDPRYLNAENAEQQAEAEAAITREVERELAGDVANTRPQIDLEALHAAIGDLIECIDDEDRVPERFQGTAKATIARQDARILDLAASVVHRLMLWDKHPNVTPERYFAPGRGPSQ